ncbi:EmrB/QacA subfamily drug resistance transporter [Paraburkholderia sp. 32]
MSNGTPPGAIPHGTSPPNTARSFRQSLFAMLGLSSVVMMVAIDQTVVGTALPTIVAELKGFNLYAWVATAYLLASVITVPIFGRLGDWFGRKPLIVIAIVVFTAASVLCGAAHSMQALVLFRALQGIGGGMLVGTCFASIPDLFPDPVVRLRWQVLFSSAFGVANAVGPSLGGFLSEHYGWRSAFLVNLPVGVLSLYLTARHLPNIRHQLRGKLSPDWRGALLIAAGLGALQLLVESLAQQTLKVSTIAFGVVALSAGALLVREELRAADPILPPALLRERAIIALLALSMLMGLAMFALLFYVPLLLQGGMGLNADRAGVMVTPLVLCITVGTIANTRVVTRLRKPNVLLYVGFALLGVACWGVAAERMETGHALMAALTAGGVGIGLVMPNLTVFAQQVGGQASAWHCDRYDPVGADGGRHDWNGRGRHNRARAVSPTGGRCFARARYRYGRAVGCARRAQPASTADVSRRRDLHSRCPRGRVRRRRADRRGARRARAGHRPRVARGERGNGARMPRRVARAADSRAAIGTRGRVSRSKRMSAGAGQSCLQ